MPYGNFKSAMNGKVEFLKTPGNGGKQSSFEDRTRLVFLLLFAAAAVFQLFSTRFPHVYGLYDGGTLKFFSGADPYPAEFRSGADYGNWFVYPPVFTFLFLPFSSMVLGPAYGAFGWVLLNLLVFYGGVMAVIDQLGGNAIFRRWRMVAAIFLVTNEMLGAALGTQSNALVTGLMLLGGVSYARGRFTASGLLLAIAAAIKIHPLVLVLLLALGLEWRFIVSVFGFLLAFTFLPAVVTGWDTLFRLFEHLAAIFFADTLHDNFLGIQPALNAYGWFISDKAFTLFMLVNAAAVALVCLPKAKDANRLAAASIPLALAFIILFNKRTESLSFVILAPVFLFMLLAHLIAKDAGETAEAKLNLRLIIAGWMLISYFSSDLFPGPLRDIVDTWHLKTLGGLLAYGWAWRAALRA